VASPAKRSSMSADAVGIRCDTSAVIALRVPAELNDIMKLLPIDPSTETFPMLVIAESELSADEIAPAVALYPIAPLVSPPKERVNVPLVGTPVRVPTPNLTLDPVISTTLNGDAMLPVASRKYRLIALLSPLIKRGGAAGVKFVKLVASLRLVMSINRSRAIYSGVLSTASHFPSGHLSVAMRSFAHVEHPHLRQRPVELSAVASHSGQDRQMASRVVSASGGVVAKPARAKRCAAAVKRLKYSLASSNAFSSLNIKTE